MSSITLHKLDSRLESLIRQKAADKKWSLNKTIQHELLNKFGFVDRTQTKQEKILDRTERYKEFFGMWTKEEAEEFEKNTACFSVIDPNDWK